MELLPGARFGISVESSAVAWWGQRLGGGSGLVGRDLLVPCPSGGSTVFLGPGPWDFSPGRARVLRESN